MRLRARRLRKLAGTAVAAVLLFACGVPAAKAANMPVDPPAGASFDTTETYNFSVGYESDDAPWAIVLTPDDGSGRGITFPSDDPDGFEVDMGWLASKYDHLGRFNWSICDYDEAALQVVQATCSEPRPFGIRFRLSTLAGVDARSHARRVYKKMTRFALPANGVKCRRISRTKRACKVGTYMGDAVIYGRVVLWNKRPRGVRTYDLTRYRASLRIYDEYCHLVNKRPLSECDKPYKKRSGWTYRL